MTGRPEALGFLIKLDFFKLELSITLRKIVLYFYKRAKRFMNLAEDVLMFVFSSCLRCETRGPPWCETNDTNSYNYTKIQTAIKSLLANDSGLNIYRLTHCMMSFLFIYLII